VPAGKPLRDWFDIGVLAAPQLLGNTSAFQSPAPGLALPDPLPGRLQTYTTIVVRVAPLFCVVKRLPLLGTSPPAPSSGHAFSALLTGGGLIEAWLGHKEILYHINKT